MDLDGADLSQSVEHHKKVEFQGRGIFNIAVVCNVSRFTIERKRF